MTASRSQGLVFLLGLTSLALAGQSPQARAQAEGRNVVLTAEIKQNWALGRGLDDRHSLWIQREEPEAAGGTLIWAQQQFQGVRVLGGEMILRHSASGRTEATADALVRNFSLDTIPSLRASEALAITHIDTAPRGEYTAPPAIELVVYPVRQLVPRASVKRPTNAADFEEIVVRHELAYLVHVEIEQGADTRHENRLIHAHTGQILQRWSSLHTAAQEGLGNSQHSGPVKLSANTVAAGFELRDPLRAGNYTTDMRNTTSGSGDTYTHAINEWGDGANHLPGTSGDSINGQTAAVDAHYGMQVTWDFLKQVLGRNGIDGHNRPVFSRVHYSTDYDNAFWSDACFCMTFGDGSLLKTLTSLDVAAHEMAHGVTSNTANLAYYGESGGLNEATSDIFGTMIEFYARGANGQGPVVPDTGGNWTLGEQLVTPRFPNPLRYMYKPSLDGHSPDAWNPSLGSLDVHFSSGPMNRAFYFLSQGASADAASPYRSTYLPAGMKGLGNDKALRIWWRTLTTRLTSASNYLAARNGAIASAGELYGYGSPEEAAVWNAYAAINVGSPWNASDTIVPTVVAKVTGTSGILTFTATATDNVGVTRVEFLVDGTFKGSASASPFALPFNSASLSNGSHSLAAKAYDTAGNVGTSIAVPFTVSNKDLSLPTVAARLTGTTGTLTFTANASDNVGVTKVEYLVDSALKGSATTAPYTFTFNSATVANGGHSLVARAYDAAGNIGTSAAVVFTVSNQDLTAPVVSAKLARTATSFTFTASATDNVGVTRVDYLVDGILKGTATAAPYTLALASATLTNGVHTLVAKAYDAAGNAGTSAALSFILDTLPPTVTPRVDGISGTLAFTATASDNLGVTKVEYLVDGLLKGSATTTPYAFAFKSTIVANGAHSLVAMAYDVVGNIGTSTAVVFTVSNQDLTAPVVAAKLARAATSLTFTASATDNVGVTRVEYLVDGTLKGTATAAPYTLALASATLTNGVHTLVAKAYDAAGNAGTSAVLSFILDTLPPTVTPRVDGTSGTLAFTATASDNLGVTKVEYLVDGLLKGSATTAPYAFAFKSATVADGDHRLVAKAYDASGNMGTSTPILFKVGNAVSSATFLELESNDSVVSANRIPELTLAIRGALATGLDMDTFAIPLVAGQGLQLTLTSPAGMAYGMRLAPGFPNPTPQGLAYVQVYSLRGQGSSNLYNITIKR